MMRGGLSALLAPAAMSAALVLTACPNTSGTGGSDTGGGGSATTGGGGSGGATTTSTTSTTTTGPLMCSTSVSNPPLGGDCDLLQQDCEPGKTCIAGPTKTVCQFTNGLKGPGKACNLDNGTKECQSGLICIGANGIGICTRPCCPDNNEPCGGGDCNGEVDFGSTVVTMCSYAEQCTLFVDGTCDPGLKCQLVYTNQGLSVCTLPAPENKAEGETCQFVNQCGENQVCQGGFCRYNCKLDGTGEPGKGACLAMQKCLDIYPETAGGQVGVCQPE